MFWELFPFFAFHTYMHAPAPGLVTSLQRPQLMTYQHLQDQPEKEEKYYVRGFLMELAIFPRKKRRIAEGPMHSGLILTLCDAITIITF